MHKALYYPGYPPRIELYHPVTDDDMAVIREVAESEIGEDVAIYVVDVRREVTE